MSSTDWPCSKELNTLAQILQLPEGQKPTREWLTSQASELKRLEENDSYSLLLKPQNILSRISRHLPFTPARAERCSHHKSLNPHLIRKIFLQITEECTTRISYIIASSFQDSSQTQQATPPLIQSFIQRMQNIQALWMSGSLFQRLYSFEPGFDRIKSGCEACIISTIGGNPQVLCDLRASIISRKRKGRWLKPRLLRLVDFWIRITNQEQEILTSSRRLIVELRKFKGKGKMIEVVKSLELLENIKRNEAAGNPPFPIPDTMATRHISSSSTQPYRKMAEEIIRENVSEIQLPRPLTPPNLHDEYEEFDPLAPEDISAQEDKMTEWGDLLHPNPAQVFYTNLLTNTYTQNATHQPIQQKDIHPAFTHSILTLQNTLPDHSDPLQTTYLDPVAFESALAATLSAGFSKAVQKSKDKRGKMKTKYVGSAAIKGLYSLNSKDKEVSSKPTGEEAVRGRERKAEAKTDETNRQTLIHDCDSTPTPPPHSPKGKEVTRRTQGLPLQQTPKATAKIITPVHRHQSFKVSISSGSSPSPDVPAKETPKPPTTSTRRIWTPSQYSESIYSSRPIYQLPPLQVLAPTTTTETQRERWGELNLPESKPSSGREWTPSQYSLSIYSTLPPNSHLPPLQAPLSSPTQQTGIESPRIRQPTLQHPIHHLPSNRRIWTPSQYSTSVYSSLPEPNTRGNDGDGSQIWRHGGPGLGYWDKMSIFNEDEEEDEAGILTGVVRRWGGKTEGSVWEDDWVGSEYDE